jgi:hypothetical protein
MLFELPIVYDVTGVKHGNRRATTSNVVEMVEVDIRVVDEADAPVVVEWNGRIPDGMKIQSTTGYGAPDFSPVPPDGKLNTRLINDRHFCPVIGIDMPGWIGPRVGTALLHETRGVGVWRDIFHLKDLPTGPFTGIDNLAKKGLIPVTSVDKTFESVEKSTKSLALDRLQRAVDDCAFVGDMLYRVCSEPKIIIANVRVTDERGVWQMGHIPFVTSDQDHAAQYLGRSPARYEMCELKSWKSVVRKCHRLNARFRKVFDPFYADRAPVLNDILDRDDYRLLREVEKRMNLFLAFGSHTRISEISTAVTRAFCMIVDANELILEPGGLDKLETALESFVEMASSEKFRERQMAEYAAEVQEVLATRRIDIGVHMQRVGR